MKKIGLVFSLFFFLSILFQTSAQWYQQNISDGGYLGGFKFTSENIGWVYSNPFKIYRTTDGGDSWNFMYQTDGPITSIFFLDDNNGWITYWESAGSKIIYTSDGGINWTQRFYGNYYSFSNLYFFNSLNGLAFGIFGSPQSDALFRTNNGGYNWEIVFGNLYYISIYFVDSLTGWAGGYSLSGINSIKKTTDGGITWIDFPSDSLNFIRKIQFFNNSVGWVIAGNELYFTLNGGLNWNLSVSLINDFCFVDQNNGWYVSGDKIFKTSNAGTNWNLQYANNGRELFNILFKDINSGWAGSDSGLVLRTINGGIPVELTSFTSSVTNNNVTLNWQTATETNNQGFELQRLNDSKIEILKNWENIGFVNGKGTTTELQAYSFVDENLEAGKYQYRLKQIDFDGTFDYSNTNEVEINSPAKFSLAQNYPNPFNPSTKISWQSPVGNWQTLKVYDILGNEVATLVNEEKAAGKYEIEFNSVETLHATSLPSGVYFYQLKAGDYIETKKMILMR
jgi:photosystem II stability/assembly factor-like uncharacterized protein